MGYNSSGPEVDASEGIAVEWAFSRITRLRSKGSKKDKRTTAQEIIEGIQAYIALTDPQVPVWTLYKSWLDSFENNEFPPEFLIDRNLRIWLMALVTPLTKESSTSV